MNLYKSSNEKISKVPFGTNFDSKAKFKCKDKCIDEMIRSNMYEGC